MNQESNNFNNPYYLAFIITTQLFENENINRAIETLRNALNADYISIYKENDGAYKDHIEVKKEKVNIDRILLQNKVNDYKNLIETKDYFTFPKNINTDSLFSSSIFIHYSLGNNKYILGIYGIKENSFNIENNIDILNKILSLLIKKMELYDEMKKLVYEDALTGLENRYQFNKKIKEINNSNKKYVFAIFDLFRLKYVNDNFSHELGDKYIQESAKIIKKYFPKYITVNQDSISRKEKTGISLYRIGGDEFVAISDSENYETFKNKAQKASLEVENLDIALSNNIPLGLNYGIAQRLSLESGKELYINADLQLQDNKREKYLTLGLDRRK